MPLPQLECKDAVATAAMRRIMFGEISGWFIGGGVLLLFGFLIFWRTSGWDLWGTLFESIWQLIRGKRTAIQDKVGEIGAAPGAIGKARRAASTVIGHFVAQVLGLIALISILVGAAMIAIGFYAT